MNQMSLDCNRIASPNPLWMNLVGAGSIAIFSTMVGISSQPAQANQPEQSVTPGTETIDFEPSPILANSPELAQQPQPVTKETVSQLDVSKASVTPPITSDVAVTKAASEPVLEVVKPVAQSKVGSDKERQNTSQNPCDSISCNSRILGVQNASLTVAQLPYPPQTINPIPVPAAPIPGGGSSNSTLRQLPYLPQPQSAVPVPPPAANNYSPMGGQAYYPQMMMLVPVPSTGMMQPPTGYPQMGQPAYNQQMLQPLPAQIVPNQMGYNGYPQQLGQPYYPQVPVAPLPAQLVPNQMGYNGYPQQLGQPYYQQVPVAPNPGFNNYPQPQQLGQPPYYQQVPVAPNPGFNGYPQPQPQQLGQSPYYQQVPVAPNPGFNNYPQPQQLGQQYYQQVPVAPNPGFNNYPQPQQLGQSPYYQQVPVAPNPGFNGYPQQLVPVAPSPTPTAPLPNQQPLLRSTALTAPSLQLQGTYINQGDQSSARARLAALYPLTPQVQFGATLDLTSEANSFADSRGQGLNVNELYVAAAPFTGLPNLRFVVGQLDLTSYFDRNSFAKDGASQFFNPVFQTNPALSATGIASRPGVLVNWTLTDNIEAKAGVFSSSRSLGDFSLDAFAGEIGFRYGNAIIRGTYSSDRDAGSRDGFREIGGVRRADGSTGIRSSDREDSYGVNAEYFVPNLNMGLFARYGRYENQAIKRGGDTYSFGVSFADVISKDDRLGLAYGRNLSNDLLRQVAKADVPDVLELFYDFRFLSNLRLGFTLQQRNGFEDTYAGFRIKTDFDLTPRGRLNP